MIFESSGKMSGSKAIWFTRQVLAVAPVPFALTFTAALAVAFAMPSISLAQFEYRVGSRVQASNNEHRTSELSCSISLFFSFEHDERFDIKAGPESAKMDGRGLLNCKNDQGFTTEVPVLATLDADLPTLTRIPSSESSAATSPTEVSFSANSGAFVIPREINQIYDRYDVRNFPWDKTSKAGEVALTLRGQRNDLVVGMKFNSRGRNLEGLKVRGLKLSFDEAAPDLND